MLGTGTINMPNTHPAAVAAQAAMLDHLLQGPLHHGHQPGRADVRRRGVRQLRPRPQRDVRRGHQHGAEDLGIRAALRHRGRVLERLGGQDHDPRDRPGLHHEALPEAAPAHRRHRGGAVLAGRDRDGQARLGADLRQLPDARMGEDALAQIRRRPAGRGRGGRHPPNGAWPRASSSPTTKPRRSATRWTEGGPYHFYFKQLVRKLVGGGRGNLFKTDPAMPDAATSRPTTSRSGWCWPAR